MKPRTETQTQTGWLGKKKEIKNTEKRAVYLGWAVWHENLYNIFDHKAWCQFNAVRFLINWSSKMWIITTEGEGKYLKK